MAHSEEARWKAPTHRKQLMVVAVVVPHGQSPQSMRNITGATAVFVQLCHRFDMHNRYDRRGLLLKANDLSKVFSQSSTRVASAWCFAYGENAKFQAE